MKNFFVPFKVLMMRLIVALVLFPATPFNESTAEASEVFAYSEGNIDYYVDTNIDVWLNLPGIGYGANMKAYGSSYPPILTIRYVFMDSDSREEGWLDNQGWGYEVVFQYTVPIGGNPFFNHIGHLGESWKAQKVFNIVYPKILEKRRERREEKQRIADEKRREEQRIADEKRREAEKRQRIEAERKKIFNSLIAQGDSSYIAKDYVAAIRNYDEAKNVDKNSVDKFFSELVKNGDRLKSQGNYSAALDYYKKALTMNSSDSNCRSKLWDTYSKVKNFDDAVSFYKAMTTVYCENAYYWFRLAYSYGELGNYENAVTAYTNSIQLNPNDAGAYNNRGIAYYCLKQYERAIQDYDKAIQLNPNYDKAYYNRGNTYYHLGQNERAIQAYNKAIQLNPNYAEAYNNRGFSYEHMKKYKKALKDYKKALELDPNDEDAKQGIERVSKMK